MNGRATVPAVIDLRRFIRDDAVTRAFYGSVVYAALVSVFAAEAVQPPPGRAIGGVVLTAVILFVAHGFAELVPRVVHAAGFRWADLRHVARAETPLLVTAIVPVAPLLLGAFEVVSPATAYRASLLTTLAGLFLLATALCRRDGLGWGRSLGAGAGILAATSVVIALEAWVTH
jgi:hypothetical protein